MSNSEDDKGLLLGLLLAGVAAVGLWKFLGLRKRVARKKSLLPCCVTSNVCPIRFRLTIPKRRSALNRLSAAKSGLDLQQMRDAGCDMGDPELDEAYIEMQRLEYDFIVAHGADPKAIRLRYRDHEHVCFNRAIKLSQAAIT